MTDSYRSAVQSAAELRSRTVEIAGLPPVTDLKENYDIETQLYSLFEGLQVENISIVPGKGIAFAKVDTLYRPLLLVLLSLFAIIIIWLLFSWLSCYCYVRIINIIIIIIYYYNYYYYLMHDMQMVTPEDASLAIADLDQSIIMGAEEEQFTLTLRFKG